MTDDQPDDARTAFLFQCGDSDLFAVSLDKRGANVPAAACDDRRILRQSFPLGAQEAMPIGIAPEPVLRGVDTNGYFIWRGGSIFGTSQ